MPKRLHGVLPIVHTPFTDRDEIDVATLRREIDWAYAQGADGLGTGMVSELLRLTYDERIALTHYIAEMSAGRGAVFAGVGAESTKQALIYAKAAEKAGCDAVMAVPPVMTGCAAAQIVDYFCALADGISLTVIVQDASGYVGKAIPIDVYVKLLDRFGPEKIVFKPEASPIGRHSTCGQLSPRHRGHNAGYGTARRRRRPLESARARRRGSDLSHLLSDLRHHRAAIASRPRRIPRDREGSARQTRHLPIGATSRAKRMGSRSRNGC
jgi:dihydrodipicolinate synthase/N-acetylneuraminate lyase